MKKLVITTLIITLFLTACSASALPTANSAAPAGSLPMATQLIIGTFKLKGTEHDITAEQAGELLPLWQVYSGLLSSDSAAQEEKDGLIDQIQATMTDQQMQAIMDMNLSQQDVMALMQEKGLGMGMGGAQGLSADQIATAQALRNSGGSNGFSGPPDGGAGMAAGGPPDGGGMPGGGLSSTNQSSSGNNTNTSAAARGPMGGGVPSALIDALIEMLKEKAG